MTDHKVAVLDAEPSAVCLYDEGRASWKVWFYVANLGADPTGSTKTAVALSQSWETAATAWKDAADSVERRRTREVRHGEGHVDTDAALG
jgi:hypothetical protein